METITQQATDVNTTKAPDRRTILAVDDNATNLALLRVHIKRMGLESLTAPDGATGIALAVEHQPSLILLDVMMPDMDGYETCGRLKADQRTADIPVIFISAKDDAVDRVQGLNVGAVDYIAKPFDPDEFRARITAVLQVVSRQETLTTAANTDGLTGLYNRRHIMQCFERELESARSDSSDLSVVMIDIDHFKRVNDTHGHPVGDIILKQLSRLLMDNTHRLDLVGRYGGEEMVIVMPGTSADHAMAACEKLRALVADTQWDTPSPLTVTISMGVSHLDMTRPVTAGQLITQADNALYEAKRTGRNRVILWQSDSVDVPSPSSHRKTDDLHVLRQRMNALARQYRHDMLNHALELEQTAEQDCRCCLGHGHRVRHYARQIAQSLGLDKSTVSDIADAAVLHDLGKVSIAHHAHHPNDTLTDDERAAYHRHPLETVAILEPLGAFQNLLPLIRHHHERIDGRGFPDALSGKKIPFGAKIIAAADTYDMLTAFKGLSSSQALDQMLTWREQRLDREVVDALVVVAETTDGPWPLPTDHSSCPAPSMASS